LRSEMVDSNRERNVRLVGEIKNNLEFQDMSLETVESTLDERMKGYSNLLVSQYFAKTKSIETADLNAVRKALYMNDKLEDLYIINTNGIVVNTTFPKDKGLNLFNFGIEHENYLKGVLKGGKFVSERFTIESSTKRLKKYTYQPTRDGKYIIELGVYSQKADEIIAFIKKRLNTITEEQATIKHVDLFIITDIPFSLSENATLSKDEQQTVDSLCKTRTFVTITKKVNGRQLEFNYIYMDRKNSALYKGSVIKIVSDRANEALKLRNKLIQLFIIFGLVILIVVIMLYQKTKVITNPIKNLVNSVSRITDGHFNERADVIGNNEIATLSERFNHMIEELESLYNDLEQKVRDRTAEIMAQKEEIEAQRDSIELQKDMLEEINNHLELANKEITDSIVYAKRIQTSILPAKEQIKKSLPDSFVLYRPKDIVSGDFYWFNDVSNMIMIAAVDCTGHGVPGAFMSIVGYSNLNYAVTVKGARTAGTILNELNHGVIDTLRQQNSEATIRDGMDLALCCFDFTNNKVHYAGANNPMILIRNNELTQFEPTKAPIGANDFSDSLLFQDNEISIQKGDCIYIFSDGYADQFGGPRNKKFLKSRLLELLIKNNALSMEEQKVCLDRNFDEWKGANDQLDDILVIGIRV